DLSFFACPQITSLSVLSGISSVGQRLLITTMNGLQNLTGLQNITKVGSDLHVSTNNNLISLSGLQGLDSVGRDLVIGYNPLLINLNGLRNLRKTYLVSIQNNPTLSQFCGLYSLYAAGGPTFTNIFSNQVNPSPAQILSAGPCTSVALPVLLKVFNVQCERNKTILTWVTSIEYRNSHFVLQRSINGNAWTNLGIIPASTVNGNEHKYSFSDDHPISNSFYRLAQFDMDGKVHYSSILRSACDVQKEFNIWPNPATDKIVVTIQTTNASKGLIRIFDRKGALIRSKYIALLPGLNQIEMDLGIIANGTYMVQITNEGGTLQKNKMFLKK
ncbi:MAG: T9SS type A sorting domain-containing protein, partial [Flavisolibacter sp.]